MFIVKTNLYHCHYFIYYSLTLLTTRFSVVSPTPHTSAMPSREEAFSNESKDWIKLIAVALITHSAMAKSHVTLTVFCYYISRWMIILCSSHLYSFEKSLLYIFHTRMDGPQSSFDRDVAEKILKSYCDWNIGLPVIRLSDHFEFYVNAQCSRMRSAMGRCFQVGSTQRLCVSWPRKGRRRPFRVIITCEQDDRMEGCVVKPNKAHEWTTTPLPS